MILVESPSADHAGLYADNIDRLKHHAYIFAIAQEKGRSVVEVADYYEHILGDLQQHAYVWDYFNVFVAKKVFELLRQQEGR